MQGVTLIEFLIVITIAIILAVVLSMNLYSYYLSSALSNEADRLVATLRDAQNRSFSRHGDAGWGIYIENGVAGKDFYSLHSGASYVGLASSTYYLPSSVEFFDPADGQNKEIVFALSSGVPALTATVTLRLVNKPSAIKTIVVNRGGSISY